MKRQSIIFLLLGCLLISCASSGRYLSADKLKLIKPGETTRQQMIEWFGPAMYHAYDDSGLLSMTWYYNEAQSYIVAVDVKQQILSARFDDRDILRKYTLTDNVNK